MKKFLAMAAALALAAPAAADEFQLANGRKIQGIERPDPDRPDRVIIEVGAGVIELDSREVLSRSPGRTDLHEYYERWERVKGSKKASDFFDLARWAREHRCHKFVLMLCEKAVTIDPDHEGARSELGHRKVEGKWLTFEEAQEAKGLVLFEGRWVTEAERELVVRERLEAKERAETARRERERKREEERQRRLEAQQAYNEWVARVTTLPYGYLYRPNWFWPAYYRPNPYLPYQYKRPPGGYYGSNWGGCWDAVPTFNVFDFVPVPTPFYP